MADKSNADREAAEKIEHRPTCAALDPQTERPCDCSEVQRLRDLVRYCRHQLHEERLISDEEFTDLLSNTPGAVARLEGYDKAVAAAKRDIARKMLDTCPASWIDDLLSGPASKPIFGDKKGGTWGCPEIEMLLLALKSRMKAVAKDNGVEIDV
jgi:hypothetical protein